MGDPEGDSREALTWGLASGVINLDCPPKFRREHKVNTVQICVTALAQPLFGDLMYSWPARCRRSTEYHIVNDRVWREVSTSHWVHRRVYYAKWWWSGDAESWCHLVSRTSSMWQAVLLFVIGDLCIDFSEQTLSRSVGIGATRTLASSCNSRRLLHDR